MDVLTVDDVMAGDNHLTFEVVGEISHSDLALLDSGQRIPSAGSPLERLRPRHHALAKSLARGLRPSIAAATHGYSVSRVSILQADPAFSDLVAHYRANENHDYALMQERLTGLSVAAMDELEERLEKNPESIQSAQLTRIIAVTADRTGHGPASKTDHKVTYDIGARLAAARERKQLAQANGPIIDHED